ncbi:MAG TPA: DUF3566 domain-containing protein [Chthoniobacterales bacterium]|jgi:hypothetical protein
MKRRIKRIAPLQAGKMLGVVYAGFGLLFLPFFAIAGVAGAFAQHAEHAQGGLAVPVALTAGVIFVMGFFFPVFYGLMGFVFGMITAAIYNLVAHWIGGIEVEVEECGGTSAVSSH